jgi:hypothetical protein
MTIESQWIALEMEAANDKGSWRMRLARPMEGYHLFVAVQGGRRHLLLRVNRAAIPTRASWPDCTGLEILAVELECHTYLGVALREARFADVFAALAEDLSRRIETADTLDAASVFMSQLLRWQRFLAASARGLSEAARRGLWGELHFMLEVLVPVVGGGAAFGWMGPHAGHQDFRLEAAWVEVKTTLANLPQAVRVTSERQLDETHAPALFLHVLALDAVEGGETTLPALVRRVRSALSPWPQALEQFEDGLLAASYLDLHAPHYAGMAFVVRRQDMFRVGPGFPHIVENDLPLGVGDVSYSLSLAACHEFSVPMPEFVSGLQMAIPNM